MKHSRMPTSCLSRKTPLSALAAGVLAACALAGASAMAAIVTYEFTGVKNGGGFASYNGQPMNGRIVVDTSVAPTLVVAATNNHEYVFPILSATVQIGGFSIESKPYGDFDQNLSPQTPTWRNYIRMWEHPNGYNILSAHISSTGVDLNGNPNWTFSDIIFRIEDRSTGALSIPGLPEDLSSFEFGEGLDIALLSVGAINGSISSTFVAGNGSVSIVPEPSTAALFGLAGALALVRRRKAG